jgi:uncharacterized protein
MLGSAVCDALLARGDEVVGLTRDPDKARPKNPTVTWHAWQPTTEPPPEAALEGIDGVANLIGENINQRLTDQAKVRLRETRVVATRNLLEGVKASRTEPSVFVGQSTIGYYGDRGAELIDEQSGLGEPSFITELVSDWEATEREAEGIFDRVVIFRTAPVLAKEGGLIKQLYLPFKLGIGGPIAGGDQYLSWIHIEDVVGLFLWALDDHRVWGLINATAPNPVTNREFSKALGRALHRPAFIPIPKFAVAVLRGGELADAVAEGARVLPRRAVDLGYEFRHPELDEALRSALR